MSYEAASKAFCPPGMTNESRVCQEEEIYVLQTSGQTQRTFRFFNTLTRNTDTFTPIEAGKVSLYCCGPTVYNYAHIGNLRTYFFEDILRRALTLGGYQVHHVMNITDVGHLQSDADDGDDKMQLAAKREQKSPWDIARFYEEAFMRHIEQLNIQKPNTICRATEHIEHMIRMVEKLVDKGHAYISGNNVYYDVSTFPSYSEFGNLQLDDQQATERVDDDERKRNPADFVLWFSESKYPNQIMKWDSPWGTGFPGWHIECSAMASEYLGEQIDIHCGGIDHISVHHTNEIAQSEGCFGCRWVNYWMHGAFLTIDKGKMSKSSGNFLHLDKLTEEGYSPMEYRYLMLTAHYRAELKFSYESLVSSRGALSTFKNLIKDWRYEVKQNPDVTLNQDALNRYTEEFWDAVTDDLHMPKALSVAWAVARDKELGSHEKLQLLLSFDELFGLDLSVEEAGKQLTPEMEELLAQREQARAEKNWARSDELRDQLLALGVAVKDRRGGTDWEFVD